LLFSESFVENSKTYESEYGTAIWLATMVVFAAYIIQLIILGATEAAKRSPSGPRLAFLILSISLV